jgi:hypothetical protein
MRVVAMVWLALGVCVVRTPAEVRGRRLRGELEQLDQQFETAQQEYLRTIQDVSEQLCRPGTHPAASRRLLLRGKLPLVSSVRSRRPIPVHPLVRSALTDKGAQR